MYNRISRVVIVSVCVMFVSAYAVAQGITQPKQGQGGSVVQGAAGTEGSVGDNGLEHCPKPMGALAVVEPQQEILYGLRRYNLQSPVGLIRMMIQQSNCFIVVERGVGMQNMMQERQLAEAGHARQGSNIGGGQMVAADFIMTLRGLLGKQRRRWRRRGRRTARSAGRSGRRRCRRHQVQGGADQHARR